MLLNKKSRFIGIYLTPTVVFVVIYNTDQLNIQKLTSLFLELLSEDETLSCFSIIINI